MLWVLLGGGLFWTLGAVNSRILPVRYGENLASNFFEGDNAQADYHEDCDDPDYVERPSYMFKRKSNVRNGHFLEPMTRHSVDPSRSSIFRSWGESLDNEIHNLPKIQEENSVFRSWDESLDNEIHTPLKTQEEDSIFQSWDEILGNEIHNLPKNQEEDSIFQSWDTSLDNEVHNLPNLAAEEVDIAIAAAAERLMQTRNLEYRMYQNQNYAARPSAMYALGSVIRPSVQMQNLNNETDLCEMVTYECMRQPNLRSMIKELTDKIKKMYETRVVDILVRDTVELKVKLNVEAKIKSMLMELPNQEILYEGAFISSSRQRSNIRLGTRGTCKPSENQNSCSNYLYYRSYSGWCNNLKHPGYGESNIAQRRFLHAEYDDGISTPRTRSRLGPKLPSPRKVSIEVHTHEFVPDKRYTLLVMQWGQIIAHDLAHTPAVRGFNESVLDCSSCDSGSSHPACFPIPVPSDDPFFASNSAESKCIPFTRSMCGQRKLGPREQVNQVTSHLDGELIYGSDECKLDLLREPNSYLMRTSKHPLNSQGFRFKDLLSLNSNGVGCRSEECFFGGDARVNEHPGLIVVETVMLREHNRIATELAQVNPHWDVNKVFKETRRIVVAEIQHITYNEYLPRVLGPATMKAYKLEPMSHSYYNGYDEQCSTEIFNEFGVAAFRFGHSTVHHSLSLMSEEALLGKEAPREILLRNHFLRPDVVLEEKYAVDDLLRGLMVIPEDGVDHRQSLEIANHLFQMREVSKSGLDLFALNIQRGRDHGIPGYNKYRKMCGLRRASFFKDFSNEIPQFIIDRFEKVYDHPDDVDLFTGLLSEKKLKGSLAGPTMACLLGLQFSHIRKCDRFWYETGDPDLRFTPAQLQQIRSTSIAGLICYNMDMDTLLPRSPFDLLDKVTNPIVRCSKDIEQIDLSHWKEQY